MEDATKLLGFDGYFATRLRELMKNANVTQQTLANDIGITRQAISQYMDGSVQPNIEKLYKIADYFNVSADFLLGRSDVMGKNSTVNNICEKLGLSEKAVKMLMLEYRNFVSGQNEECGRFRDFVNIFADVDEMNVDGIAYWDFYLYQSILNFLQYKKQLPIGGCKDNPADTSITLVAFKREEPNGMGKMKFHKVLQTIDEENLLTVFLLEIQRELRALKNKLEEEKYFEDGGVAYRLKVKQDDDAVKQSIYKDYCNPDDFDIEDVETFFEEQQLKREKERSYFDDDMNKEIIETYGKSIEEWKLLTVEERHKLMFDTFKNKGKQ